MLNISKRYYRS